MTNIATRICGMATAAVVTGGLSFGAMAAEDLQRFHIKLVGGAIGMYQTKAIEMPWAETVGKESNGQITAEILPHDMVGIEPSERDSREFGKPSSASSVGIA